MSEMKIRINGSTMHLDSAALRKGTLKLSEKGSDVEQCEGCGDDIMETGEPRANDNAPRETVVVCGTCGTVYPAVPA